MFLDKNFNFLTKEKYSSFVCFLKHPFIYDENVHLFSWVL